jgi:hypothetical protein
MIINAKHTTVIRELFLGFLGSQQTCLDSVSLVMKKIQKISIPMERSRNTPAYRAKKIDAPTPTNADKSGAPQQPTNDANTAKTIPENPVPFDLLTPIKLRL